MITGNETFRCNIIILSLTIYRRFLTSTDVFKENNNNTSKQIQKWQKINRPIVLLD